MFTYFLGTFASHRVTGRVQSISQLWDDHFTNGMTQYLTKVLPLSISMLFLSIEIDLVAPLS